MTKADLVYQNEEYEIYKKGSGELGHFQPSTALDLMSIALDGLREYENGGFLYAEEYEEVVEDFCRELKNTIKK